MIGSLLGWILFSLLIIAFCAVIYVYIFLRKMSDRVLRTCKEQFFEAATSLLETPGELPNEVLEALEIMMAAGNDPKAHWVFLRAAQSNRMRVKSRLKEKSELHFVVEGMRPELQKLFMKAQISWLGFIIYRNVYASILLHVAFIRMKSNGIDQKHAEVETSEKLLQGFEANAC